MWTWFLIAFLPFILQGSPKPYADFSKKGSGFFGAGRETPDPADLGTVRIGVLAPEKDSQGLQMRNGVQMALEEANRKGGYHGIPFEMIFRADDGPWGVGAQRVVDLAYDDQVWSVIGGLDGLKTHIAELVASRVWVPVISPAAIDASVDYANVPWVFRCPPADSRQAELLISYAQDKGFQHVVVITELQREGHVGFLRLQESARQRHFVIEAHCEFSAAHLADVVSRLHGMDLDAIILWGSADPALALLCALRADGISAPVLAPSLLTSTEVVPETGEAGDLIVAAPYDLSREDRAIAAFEERYKDCWGRSASPVAFYSYDVACLLVRVIERTGLNRMRIRDELTRASFEGLTGRIQFNSLRGNISEPVLMILRDGRWQRLR